MPDLSPSEVIVHLRRSLKFWVSYCNEMEKNNKILSQRIVELEEKLGITSNG
jgi:hypothetical protein